MRDHWGNPIGEAREDPLAQPASGLTGRELHDLIAGAVFRAVVKAVGVIWLVTALVAVLVYFLRS